MDKMSSGRSDKFRETMKENYTSMKELLILIFFAFSMQVALAQDNIRQDISAPEQTSPGPDFFKTQFKVFAYSPLLDCSYILPMLQYSGLVPEFGLATVAFGAEKFISRHTSYHIVAGGRYNFVCVADKPEYEEYSLSFTPEIRYHFLENSYVGVYPRFEYTAQSGEEVAHGDRDFTNPEPYKKFDNRSKKVGFGFVVGKKFNRIWGCPVDIDVFMGGYYCEVKNSYAYRNNALIASIFEPSGLKPRFGVLFGLGK